MDVDAIIEGFASGEVSVDELVLHVEPTRRQAST
jgi:hypothetical protein